MKTLVLAVLLAVAQAPSPVPRQASEKGTQGRQNVENKKKGNDATTGKPVLVGKEHLGRPSKPNGNEPAHIDPAPSNIRISDIPPVTVNPGKWEKAYLWFSGGLVLVGSLQVWLLFGTLRTVRRQGNNMIGVFTLRHQPQDVVVSTCFRLIAEYPPWNPKLAPLQSVS